MSSVSYIGIRYGSGDCRVATATRDNCCSPLGKGSMVLLYEGGVTIRYRVMGDVIKLPFTELHIP